MNLERWAEVERLYHLALERPPELQAAFLDQNCTDEDLRCEVLSLLNNSEGAQEYFTEAVRGAAALASESSFIGQYRILSEAGRGGMGVVYCAVDPRIGRRVAIKTISWSEIPDPDKAASLRGQFLREAQSVGILAHPNIVTFYHVGEHHGEPFIAMEFIDGDPLTHLIGPPSADLAKERWIIGGLAQIASALDYAHAKEIVHRDVKAANILVGKNRVFKIADFGIAKVIKTAQRATTRYAAGTPSYISPEQLRGEGAGPRSDQYSLAVTAFHVLTGQLPFSGKSVEALIFLIVSNDPPPPSSLNPRLTPGVDRVLRRALAKDPAARFETCAQFMDALTLELQTLSREIGWQIGPYRILGELGRGGMGIVYRAEDPAIRRQVAIKVIQLRPTADAEERASLRERFINEARAAGSLSHPGIVTIHHFGEHDGQPYVVMEAIEGGSLERYLRTSPGGAEENRKLRSWLVGGLCAVADALDFAHSHSVIHRDVKPANIFVSTGGVFKIGDFGIAKGSCESGSITQTLIGSPLYIAPEQFRGNPVSAMSDQYALGVTAYQIVTGQSPYPAKTDEELLFQIVATQPPRASSVNGDLHSSADAVFERVLSKDPAKRFPSCAVFAHALDLAVNLAADPKLSVTTEDIAPRQMPVAPPAGNAATPYLKSGRKWWSAAAVAAVLAVAAVVIIPRLAPRPAMHPGEKANPETTQQTETQNSRKASDPTNGNAGLPRGNQAVKSQREDDRRGAKGMAEGRAEANDEPKGDPKVAMKSSSSSTVIEDELYIAAGGYIMSAFEAVLSRNPMIDGTDPTRIPLAAAARTCRTDVAKLLLAKGADPNAPLTNWMAKRFPGSNSDAVTPLMKAAEFGCLDVASILLEHGADVNLTKPSPALVIAARKEKEVMARFLLDHGANPDLSGEYGGTALVEAASIPNDPIVELLLGRKASIDAPDRKGFTAVMGAAAEAHLATVNLLLSKGANPNLSNANGETALMLTTKNTAIVRALLEHGADPKATDHKGRNALMRAANSEASPDAIELLLSRGAPVNARDQLGMTALDYANPHQDTPSGQQVVAILKNAGAVE